MEQRALVRSIVKGENWAIDISDPSKQPEKIGVLMTRLDEYLMKK